MLKEAKQKNIPKIADKSKPATAAPAPTDKPPAPTDKPPTPTDKPPAPTPAVGETKKEELQEKPQEEPQEEKKLGFMGRMVKRFIDGIKSRVHKKIDSGKTTPPLKTEEEKQLAKNKIDKIMDIFQSYITNIFWKKLKKSGILKRLKVKGISGILVSLLSLIPGAGPAIGAPIKAFFIFYTTYMDLSSKYKNEITVVKKTFEALRNNKDMQETIDLALEVVEHEKLQGSAQDKMENKLKTGGKKTRKQKKRSKKTKKSKRKKYKSIKQKKIKRKYTRKISH